MSRHTIRVLKLQGTKEMSRHKKLMSQHLQDYRDIFKVCQDIIQEEGTKLCRDRKLQAMTKLENKDGNYVAT